MRLEIQHRANMYRTWYMEFWSSYKVAIEWLLLIQRPKFLFIPLSNDIYLVLLLQHVLKVLFHLCTVSSYAQSDLWTCFGFLK
jgi:hypothetical protein